MPRSGLTFRANMSNIGQLAAQAKIEPPIVVGRSSVSGPLLTVEWPLECIAAFCRYDTVHLVDHELARVTQAAPSRSKPKPEPKSISKSKQMIGWP